MFVGNNMGDNLYDFIDSIVDSEKSDGEIRIEMLQMLDSQIARERKELRWLERFRKFIQMTE